MKRGLSAYVPVRNGFALDYCWIEAAFSLLDVCHELILCDSDSTDGTREYMDCIAASYPKVRVINWPWPKVPTLDGIHAKEPQPPSGPQHFVRWLNFCREHCTYDMQLTTDADEVLDPASHDAIREAVAARECRWFHRLHFWGDSRHRTPDGCVVGSHAARLGPTELPMHSDEPCQPEAQIRQRARHAPALRFFHYGFIRRPAAFFAKSKVVQPMFCGTYDDRLAKAEQENRPWHEATYSGPLIDFNEPHPPIMATWLKERGYDYP